jgi:DNA-binding CsgD family transcriptional regulator
MLEWIPLPAVAFTAGRAYIACNAAGARLLAANDGLCLVGGRIGLQAADGLGHLEGRIDELSRPGARISFAIPRPTASFPLIVSLARLAPAELAALAAFADLKSGIGGAGDGATTAVYVLTAFNPSGLPAGFVDEFDLSDSEAQIAAGLLAGASTRVMAESRGVSMSTVLGQVRHILAKTGLDSVNQLILLGLGRT